MNVSGSNDIENADRWSQGTTSRVTIMGFLVVLVPLYTPAVAFGANGTWNPSATSGAWQTAADWLSGIIPGSTTITTDTDIAIFNSNSTTLQITPDANRDIGGITFDTVAGAYVIGTTGGNALLLTGGGQIQIASTFSGSNIAETINAPLTLEGNYTFADNSPNTNVSLNFGGAIRSGVSGVQILTVSGSGATSISGAIGGGTGVIGLTKNGTGTLTLGGSAANTYTGPTQINSGTVILNKPGQTDAIPGNLIIAPTTGGTGATVQLASSNQIDDNATVTINPTGLLSIPNLTQDYIPTLILNGGSVSTGTGGGTFLGFIANSGQIQTSGNSVTSTISGVLNLNDDSAHPVTFTVAPGNSSDIDLDIPGIVVAGGVVKTGLGGMRLSGANQFFGGFSIQQGTVIINTINNAGINGPLGANSSVSLGSTNFTGFIEYTGTSASSNMNFSLATGGRGEFLVDNAATTLALSGVLSGSGSLNKQSPGTLYLTSANSTYAGGTTLNQGTLEIGASSFAQNSGTFQIFFIQNGPLGVGTLTVNGGTLRSDGGSYVIQNPITFAGPATITGGQFSFNYGVATGLVSTETVSNTAMLTVNNLTTINNTIGGSGTLGLASGSTGTLYLTSGGNTYTGGTTVAGGTLNIGASTTVGSGAISSGPVGTGTLTLSGGTFQSDGGSYTLANQVSLSGLTTITGGAISFDPQGTTSTVALTGNTSLTVNNTTTIVGNVTGSNSLTLAANSTGTLYLSGKLPVPGGTGSTFSGGMTLAGGTLEIGGSSTVDSFVTLIFIGAGPVGTGTLTMTGGTLESDGGNYILNNNVHLSGNVTMTGLSGGSLTFDPNILPNGILLTGDTTLTVNNSTTITDQVAGGHSLTLASSSTGTLYLGNASNNYAGGTNVAGGTLSFNSSTFISGGNIFSGPLGTGPLTFSGGTLLQNGGGSTLANPVNFSGSVTISGGPLTFDPTGLQTAATVTLLSASSLTVNNATTIKNAITGGGHSLTIAAGSTGTLYLANAANTYSGGTTLRGGTLELHGSSIVDHAQSTITSGPIGTGALTLFGGTLAGDGAGSSIANQVNLEGNITTSGGGFGIDSQFVPFSSPGTVALLADSVLTVNNNIGITSIITGAHSLTLAATSTGSLYIANVTGGETFSGGLSLLGGTLEFDASSTVSGGVITQGPLGTGTLTLGGGTFRTDGGSYTLSNPLILSGNVILGPGPLVFDPAGLQNPPIATLNGDTALTLSNSTTIKNKITGAHSLSLVVGSTGILALTNALNDYSGGTTLNAGPTLQIGASSIVNSGVLISGPVGVGPLDLEGGILRSDGGSYTISNRVTLRNLLPLAGGPLTFDPQFDGATVTLTGDALFVVSNVTTIKDPISGAFGLTLGSTSTGTLDLTNSANTMSSATVLGGTLEIGASSVVAGGTLNSGPVGVGTLTLSGGILAGDGVSRTLANQVNTSGNITLAGSPLTFDAQGTNDAIIMLGDTTLTVNNLTTIKDTIVGNFTLTVATGSTGTLYLTSTASNFPIFTEAGGTVEIGASSIVAGGFVAGPLGGNNVNLSGGTLETDGGSYTIANKIKLSGNLTLAGGQMTFDGQGTGDSVTLLGSTTLTVNNTTIINDQIFGGGLTLASGSTGVLKLEAANSFSGGVNLNGGTLFIGNDASLGTGILTFGGGTLEADSGPRMIANPVTIASGPAVIDGPFDLTFTSFVNGTGGGLTKNGAGALTLAAGGSLNGPLTVNQGTLDVGGNLTAVGAANYGTVNLSGGVTLTVSGSGLDNEGLLSLSGSTLAGAGPLVNNNTLSGHGTIGGSSGFTNDAFLNITGGNLTLTNTGSNYNYGEITLASGEFLQLGAGVSLTNAGAIGLNGGLISGTGALGNFGGSIAAPGVISANLSNVSGVIVVGNGNNLTIVHPWYNGGIVQLTSLTSNVTGGAVTNYGTIQGLGALSCNVTNSGSVESNGGTLTLAGATINTAAGALNVDLGSKLIITGGLATNAGTIINSGGTFDNNSFPLTNTGVIAGFGVFRTGGSGLTNNGGISFTGGATTVIGPVTNQSGRTITVAYNPALFTGLVTNSGSATFNILNTTATFAGGFTNGGNSSFSKAGAGEVDVPVPPTLNSGSALAVTNGTMKFDIDAGSPTIGTGVTATVSSGATLELAGSVSALSAGHDRVNITNNSSPNGIHVSGTNQQVGFIDGTGTTQVNAGSDLMANHIIQSALVIGGASGSVGIVTIAASDAGGNRLDQADVEPTQMDADPASGLRGDGSSSTSLFAIGADGISSDPIAGGDPTMAVTPSGSPVAVPEPATGLLVALGALGFAAACLLRRRG